MRVVFPKVSQTPSNCDFLLCVFPWVQLQPDIVSHRGFHVELPSPWRLAEL